MALSRTLVLALAGGLAVLPGDRAAWRVPAWAAFDSAVVNGTRTRTGVPGPRYWQQRAEYRLRAELVPLSKRLLGSGTVTYHNDSPDALPSLFIHLYPNLYAPGAKTTTRVPSQLGGMVVTKVVADGRALDSVAAGPGWTVSGTVMELRLPAPLAPGASTTLEFAWNYRIPPDGAPRGGQDTEVYTLSYWYPQVAVYDDVNGWQADPYLGNGEFYMGYADYDVTFTVPAGWLVASTGTLRNPDEVLAPRVRERLAEAERGAGIVAVVDDSGRGAGRATAAGTDGKLAWHFTATNVRDVTWGASALWLWDATMAAVGDRDGDGHPDSTRVDVLYRPDRRRSAWGDDAKYARHAVETFSRLLWSYPWPHMTVIDGPASCGGMEYPMLTCIGGPWTQRTLYETTAHEIAHMWFPMQVGSDEKRFAWQDEGMAQFFQSFAIDDYFPAADDFAENRRLYREAAQYAGEPEMMRHADRYGNEVQYGVASYYKPATVLGMLRAMLGDSAFFRGIRAYGAAWRYRHPTPLDFFNAMDQAAGRDLDWFWREWFYETWRLDQAIVEVRPADGDSVDVTLENRGRAVMPVPLLLQGADTLARRDTVPVDAWLEGQKKVTVRLAAPRGFRRAEIDPDRLYPDTDRGNQVWPRP